MDETIRRATSHCQRRIGDESGRAGVVRPRSTGPSPATPPLATGSGNGSSYVRGPVQVVGVDIYHLDRDGDGIGCENG